jgi:hypothetical protein
LVTEVKEGGWAAIGRLGTGDLITPVDDQPVTAVVSLKGTLKRVGASSKGVWSVNYD